METKKQSMYFFRWCHILLILIILTVPLMFIQGQSIPLVNFSLDRYDKVVVINKVLSEHDDTLNLSLPHVISGLSIDASIELNNEQGFVRLILIDNHYKEYLIFETNYLLAPDSKFSVSNTCEETIDLKGITPLYIKAEAEHARINLQNLLISYASLTKNAPVRTNGSEIRRAQQNDKISMINAQLKKRKYLWIAGETNISKLSYAEKKMLFGGEMPNLYGWEYYAGGIFITPSAGNKTLHTKSAQLSPFVSEFSWRSRHGINWVTGVRNQADCGGCWAFSSAGTTELLANIYFNQQVNLDLSEQEILSCSTGGGCWGGFDITGLDYARNHGITNEDCFPYTAKELDCSNKCSDNLEKIKIGGRSDQLINFPHEDTLKSWIIHGAVCLPIYSLNHSVVLTGYKTLKSGDRIYLKNKNYNEWVTLQPGNMLIGKTAWEFKNSWSDSWGDNGFGYIITDLSDIEGAAQVMGPITSLQPRSVQCRDNDGDGYYTWGIGVKPVYCPSGSNLQDGDDSNAEIGPMDYYGHAAVLPATGNGLKAMYFNNKNIIGRPEYTQTDQTIDFDWGNNSPGPGLRADAFSVLWTGLIKPKYDEVYTFYTLCDDGVRLWVNNTLLIDNWASHPFVEDSGKIMLTGGRSYGIRMEYFEYKASAVAKLYWTSKSQAKEIIPQSQLYTILTESLNPSTSSGMLSGYNQSFSLGNDEVTPKDSITPFFKIYPNPTHGISFVMLEQKALLKIFDTNGKMIYSKYLNSGKTELPNFMKPNLYLIEIVDENNQIYHSKLVVY